MTRAFSRPVIPASAVTTEKSVPKASTTRRKTSRKAGDSPDFAAMSSRSRHGRASAEVSTARSVVSDEVTIPFFESTDTFAPSSVREVLDHTVFPSKLTTPSRNSSRPTSFCSTSRFTCARTVSRSPATDCTASTRYSVESDTSFGIPSRRRACAPRSSQRSSTRRSTLRPHANPATRSESRPRCSCRWFRSERPSLTDLSHSTSDRRTARRACAAVMLMISSSSASVATKLGGPV